MVLEAPSKVTCGKRRKFFARQAEQLELGAAALDVDPLFALGGEANAGTRQFAHQFEQLARRQRDGAFLVDRSGNDGADRDIEVGARKPQSVLGGFEKDIGQHRQRGFGGNCRRNGDESLLQLLTRDGELHGVPDGPKSLLKVLL